MRGSRGNDSEGGNETDISSVSVAAHELKSPLVLLRQLSLDLASGELSDNERTRVMEQLVQVSEKALRLTSDLTRAERLQSSLFPLEPVNPISVCDDVTYELQRLYQAHGRSR